MNKKNGKQGLTSAELSNFCGQVALILEAGLPLYDGMETLAGAAGQTGETGDIFQAASKRVTETGSLYDALKSDDRWPEYLVEMVGIGERSGQLEKVMRGLEAYYAREERIRTSVVNAVTYPLVLGAMLVVIVLIMLWRVLPVFQRVLNSMGIGLSESSSRMMRIGSVFGWVILAVVALIVIAVLAGLLLMKTSHRDRVMELVQKIPVIRKLNRHLSASRVSSVLSMMLSSGFPTSEALEMTSKVLSDKDAAKEVANIRTALEEGKSFADAVTATDLFEPLHERMIHMGSATGHEDQVLDKLSQIYEEQVEDQISRLVSIIEPSLVALLAVVIGAVLLTVMMPMAGILSSL